MPSSSTTVACSTRNSSAFPRATSERTVSSAPLRSRSRRTFSGFCSSRSARRCDLGVDLFVGRLRSLPARRRRAARGRRAPPRAAPVAHLVDERLRAPGRSPARYCSSVALLMRQPVREILDAPARLARRRALGGASTGTRSAAASSTLSRTAICACSFCIISRRLRMSARSSSTRVELARLVDPLVGELGQHLLLRFLDDRRGTSTSSPARSPNRSGSVAVNSRIAPGRVPRSCSSSSGDDHAGADAVEEVGRGEPLDRLAVDRARDVDRRVRVVDERVLGVGEVGEALAQRVDLLVDVVVVDRLRTAARRAARRSRASRTCGRTSTTASNSTSPSSSPAVISISGGAITSTSCSARPRRRSTRAARRAAPARAPMSVPKRASSNWRGALPGRKPGMRTSRASLRNAASIARSNSSAGTVTCSLTLLPVERLDRALHKEEGV